MRQFAPPPPQTHSYHPDAGHRWLRRATQLFLLAVVLTSPLLGGWQRSNRAEMATWEYQGVDLSPSVARRLPRATDPERAFAYLKAIGGGVAADYASLPLVDPVAGSVALLHRGWSLRLMIGLLLPLALALLAGRVFCGWFCPYGTLARALEVILEWLPWRPPRWRLPERRPWRYLLLVVVIGAGAVGFPAVAVWLLPFALLQQSIYALWLLQGGGAVLGALLGLVVVGLFFGPTTYCASLCPTGGLLGFIGRTPVRRLRITLADPSNCGRHCTLCDQACWLGLHPASGDPGPDCDNCARCFGVCPRTNLVIAVGTRR